MTTRTVLLKVLLCLVLSLAACGGAPPAGPRATLREASVVVMGQRLKDDNVTLESYPACMGVAVAPTLVLTASHCTEAVFDKAHVLVTSDMWDTTSDAALLADTAFDVGPVRGVVPRVPLLNWMSKLDPAHDGAARSVVVRGTQLVEVEKTIAANQFMSEVMHGDSGAGLEQGGSLVGLQVTCNSTDDEQCNLFGGRFVAIPPLAVK